MTLVLELVLTSAGVSCRDMMKQDFSEHSGRFMRHAG